MRFEKVLKEGSTIQWDYDSDASADDLTSTDGYTLEAKTIAADTLTVNQRPSHGFVIKGSEKIQDHHPTQQKWARKAMNIIFQKIDGDVLDDLRSGANSTLDAADFGGSAGDGIVATSANAAAIFAAAQRVLTNQNVIYDENKVFANNVVLDAGERFPAAAIPAELKEQLLLQIGFKDTGYADKVMKSGFMGPLFGFNAIASTSLPFSFRYTVTGIPTAETILVLGGAIGATTTAGTAAAAVQIQWMTTLSTEVGNVHADTSATQSITNLVELLNDPFGTTDTESVRFVRASLSVSQRRILDNISAVDNEDGSCVITITGYGTRVVSQNETTGTIDREKVHAIFGVSQSIAIVMQRNPQIAQSAGELYTTGELTGFVGKHYLAWALYGRSVFENYKPGLIDVQIDASGFSAPASVVN